jgi:hypothetical protein
VLVFGNSFFSDVPSQAFVSWWFARFFRQYHFVWSPDFDLELIRSVQPDIVLGQTVERFLTRVPQT